MDHFFSFINLVGNMNEKQVHIIPTIADHLERSMGAL